MEGKKIKKLVAEEGYVKLVGRTTLVDDIRWFSLSGSGVEFDFSGEFLGLTLFGDDESAKAAGNSDIAGEFPRFGIYVDGERKFDECLIDREKNIVIYDGVKTKKHIQIIKLSEAPMSMLGIKCIEIDSDAEICPSASKNLKIEIIGDSITCGYGVDDETAFSTATEDVTSSYSYLTAKKLDVDYSMVSFSGYGIISGYTDSDEKVTSQLVPDYYEMVGYSRGRYNGEALTNTSWDFSKYQPDIVVINLGTNDDSYCQDIEARQNEFMTEYAKFIEMVRKNNTKAYIVCAYGVMTARLFDFIQNAVDIYQEKTGDLRVKAVKLSTHLEENGYAADFHPSKKSHRIAAEELHNELKKIIETM